MRIMDAMTFFILFFLFALIAALSLIQIYNVVSKRRIRSVMDWLRGAAESSLVNIGVFTTRKYDARCPVAVWVARLSVLAALIAFVGFVILSI